MAIRRAHIADAEQIQRLINQFADEERLLARSLSEIYDNLRDFSVSEGAHGQISGVCALHICWEGLAEIRSLAVTTQERNKGMGRELIEACLEEARELGISRIFLLTYIPPYFERMGFRPVDKATLPHKIWTDCVRCVKFPDCAETAMIFDL
jgi:amino-acid N-acetyltransferase